MVAQLPFEPIFLFGRIAHHGLATFAATDCSAMYLYILSVSFFRTNLQKLMGFTPARSAAGDQAVNGLAAMFGIQSSK